MNTVANVKNAGRGVRLTRQTSNVLPSAPERNHVRVWPPHFVTGRGLVLMTCFMR
jgi:hypothetical protein